MGEILNSVWSVFTTENEMLTKIICAPTVFIEAWLGFLLFTTTLKIIYSKYQKIIYILVIGISLLFVEFVIPAPYNIIINYIIMVLIIRFLFKLSILKTFLCIIIPSISFSLIGNLILKPFLTILNITYQETESISIYRLLYLLVLYTLTYIFTKLLQFNNNRFSYIDNFSKDNKKIILLNLTLALITLSVQFVITFYYINTYSLGFTLLNFISLFAYFFISFYSLNKTMKLQVTAQNLESAENYNVTLGYLYDNVKAFHHDFDNMLFIIGGFIDNNDIDGLRKYYKNLERDSERVNNIALLNPKLINNSGIYNLLMSKYKKAQDNNVEIKLDFFFDFNRLQMPIYEFSRILGILLDNSIEAACESDEKKVNILFRDSPNNQTQIISIENTYSNKDVDTDKIYEKGKTSKNNHTGMGLWEVKQILRRHNNVVLNTTKTNKYFKQTLEIYY